MDSARFRRGVSDSAEDVGLDARLREMDDGLGEIFAADIDDPERCSAFLELVAHYAKVEKDHSGVGNDVGPESRRARCRARRGRVAHAGKGVLALCGAVVVTVMLAAVGLLGRPVEDQAAGVVPEKGDVRFAVMNTTDLGPFWFAVDNGYFRDAGFTFDPWTDVTKVSSGSDAVSSLAKNEVDIAYATYTPFIMRENQHEGDITLVAGASSAGPRSCMVVAMPDSRIKGIEDMAGARVAVTARNTVSDLLVMSALKSAGVDWRTIEWVEVPFRNMAEKLAVGEVDAAFMTEPFLSAARRNVGATPVFDLAAESSPTADIPTAGFGARASFVEKYPNTVAAFQQVMAKATAEATEKPNEVQRLLQKFADVDADTARLATLLTFQSALRPDGIQRVADLMLEFDMINRRVVVSRMVSKIPPSG